MEGLWWGWAVWDFASAATLAGMESDTLDDSATWAMAAAMGFLALLTLLLPREQQTGATRHEAGPAENSVDFSRHGDRLIRESRAQARR